MDAVERKKNLNSLVFDNSFVRELPCDGEIKNFRRQVSDACYSRVMPTQVSSPKLVAYSREVAALLEIPEEVCLSPYFAEVFVGNKILAGMEPFAMRYGGHQFGRWAGQLGDGRAINLGEVITKKKLRWALQLKGAGPTPYSRSADGLAVLRSSLREFLCSEAMFHLGVPTTRALSLMTTGELVERDMFYSGDTKDEPGAVICRVAPSFIRFGNFEILAAQNQIGLLQNLLDYTIRTYFPELGTPSVSTYLKWFEKVSALTAEMILHWMRVGFVHGVMNTDNMSIHGLTIDFGPYGWLEGYDSKWTPNTTDSQGRRYCFGDQPYIGSWNLVQLANALLPVVKEKDVLEEVLANYNNSFTIGFGELMSSKIGIRSFRAENDQSLIDEMLAILQLVETDMTIFFRNLAGFDPSAPSDSGYDTNFLTRASYDQAGCDHVYQERLKLWLFEYAQRLEKDGQEAELRKKQMNMINPKYVLRNYLVQVAIDKAENGDFSEVQNLLEVFRRPYDEQPDFEKYAQKRPEWARNKAGCSMLSCSS